MGSSSSSYAPKSIYLDVDGKVQKVSPTPLEMFLFLSLFYCFHCRKQLISPLETCLSLVSTIKGRL